MPGLVEALEQGKKDIAEGQVRTSGKYVMMYSVQLSPEAEKF
jgi:hypothetical protein